MRIGAGVALALALIVPAAHAAGAGTMAAGFSVGVNPPAGEYKDFANLGFSLNAMGEYRLTEAFALGLEASYANFSAKDDVEAARSAAAGLPARAKGQVIAFGGHGRLEFGSAGRLIPYVIAGANVSTLKDLTRYPTYSNELSQTKLGMRGGVGLDLSAGAHARVGVEADYHIVNGEPESTQYMAVTAGVTFIFGERKK
jgi:hypothetical protein